MNEHICASYHEAGHIVAAWQVGFPVGVVWVASHGEGRTQLSLFYRSSTMFREVSRDSVCKNLLFLLGGDCAEGFCNPHHDTDEKSHDEFLARFLAKRFCLSLRDVREEAARMIIRQRKTVDFLAEKLYETGRIGPFQISILQMDWLARGKTLEAKRVLR